MALQYQDMNKQKQEAMDLAESSRETEWHHPSFVAEMFWGNFRADLIHPYPDQDPADKKIGDEYLAKLESFLKANLDPNEVDRTGELPPKALQGLKEMGCFGMKIPKEYGGLGFSQINYSRAIQLVASYCGSTSAWLSAHQSIGVPQPLKMFGTPEQKKKYLPRFAKGEVSAFALTEPNVGSDPAGMETEATKSSDGKGWLINGMKLWCTNGAVADVLVVMARTPSKMDQGREKKQVTAFIVEKGMPGFEVVHRCRFMGLHGIQNALLSFKNVYVPNENIIWAEGKGLKLALMTLNTGRLTLPAASVAVGKKALESSRWWASTRKQWGALIGKHEEVADKVAHIASDTFAQEAITWYASALADKGGADIRIEAAMAKLFCSEVAWKAMYDAIQIRGGRGYESADSLKARGERPLALERGMRDIRINTILEGSTEIMHLFIAREALDKHMRMSQAILDPRTPILKKLGALFKAGLTYLFWYPRQWIHFSFWPRFAGMGALGRHFRYVAHTSHRLARSIFHLMMIHQLGLERRQLALARVVEIGTELFAIAATASRADMLLKKNPEDRTPLLLAEHFYRNSRVRIRNHFALLFRNNDKLARELADAVMKNQIPWLEEGVVKDP